MSLGSVAFLGSGETSLAGGRVFEALAGTLPRPLHIAILETPAGFELNSQQVAWRVGDFLRKRLHNYDPVVQVVAARRKDSPYSPDDERIVEPLRAADMIFMGPGSPTYATRHLRDTLAWDLVRARHRRGAALIVASAATIAMGARVLPVYEIYKAGHDVQVLDGLDFFAAFGLPLSIVPHWNNADGGADLDTSRCFVGLERFAEWCAMLPEGQIVVGLDEHTGLILDLDSRVCTVSGVGSVSVLRGRRAEIYEAGATFDIDALGVFSRPAPLEAGISALAWRLSGAPPRRRADEPPDAVLQLAREREVARRAGDFPASDRLREKIRELGWVVQDTPQGSELRRG